MFGAVVVGIGTAGCVRIRDILAPVPGSPAEKLTMKGFISRRSLDVQQGVNQISVQEAVNRDDVHVAFICTENKSHEDDIRVSWYFLVHMQLYNRKKRNAESSVQLTLITFLQAGKHICVEYPMTLKYQVAEELWDAAEKKGVILHEEHIELLSEEYKNLKTEVQGKTLQSGRLHFTGGPLKPGAGFTAFAGIARLTWLVEMFGMLSITAATMDQDSAVNYSKMTASLLTSDNRPLTWIEERGPDILRGKKIHFEFDTCTLTSIPPAPRGPVGLFMQDLIHFSAKILDQVSKEELQREKTRILHCLKLAERIQQLCQTPA